MPIKHLSAGDYNSKDLLRLIGSIQAAIQATVGQPACHRFGNGSSNSVKVDPTQAARNTAAFASQINGGRRTKFGDRSRVVFRGKRPNQQSRFQGSVGHLLAVFPDAPCILLTLAATRHGMVNTSVAWAGQTLVAAEVTRRI